MKICERDGAGLAIASRVDTPVPTLDQALTHFVGGFTQASFLAGIQADSGQTNTLELGAQILQQAGSAILAPANSSQQVVLNLRFDPPNGGAGTDLDWTREFDDEDADYTGRLDWNYHGPQLLLNFAF